LQGVGSTEAERQGAIVINLTRLDGREFTINADLIEMIESNPDTFIRLLNGNGFVVRESRYEVIGRVIAYRRQIFADAQSTEYETFG
jgi:flagellar protein FlbD